MRTVYLIRQSSSVQGQFGILLADGLKPLYTGELRWRDNRPNISCIPAGTYTVKWGRSPKFGWCWHVQDVPNRSYILIHSANFCGDKDEGFKSQVLGCIMLGTRKGRLSGQKAILASRVAVKRFSNFMGRRTFKLRIIGEGKS